MRYEVRGLRGADLDTLDIQAVDVSDARRLAQEQNLRVLSIRSINTPGARKSRFDLRLFSEELAELLDAGLSVVEAIEALASREDAQAGTMHQAYGALLKTMREGHTFSVALERLPEFFPPLYVGLIRAAESTSGLHDALTRYIEYSGRFEALRSKVVSALIYPAILLTVGGGVIAFLLGFVVPRFAAVYKGTGRPLPTLSAWLLEWGTFVSQHGVAVGLSAATLAAALLGSLYLSWRQGRVERLLAMVPPVQRRVQLFRLSRLYLTVGTLLNGGMPAVQALLLARGVAGSGPQATAIDATIEAIRRGESLTAAMSAQALTTPVSIRLLRAGEGTGRIGDMFVRAGRYHDNELGRWVERFSRSFEPILMSLIGIIVGGVVVLLYMPIFDLVGNFR